MGARNGSEVTMFWGEISVLFTLSLETKLTHPHIELDRAPQHQHGRIAVAFNDGDLAHAQDRADGREQAQQEQADDAGLLRRTHVQPQQHGNGHEDDDDVAEDGEGRQPVEGRPGGQTRPRDIRVPRLADGAAAQDENQGAGDVAHGRDDSHDPDGGLVPSLGRAGQQAVAADAERRLEACNAQLVSRLALGRKAGGSPRPYRVSGRLVSSWIPSRLEDITLNRAVNDDVVIGARPPLSIADHDASDDGRHHQQRQHDADGDDGRILGLGRHLGRDVFHPAHGGGDGLAARDGMTATASHAELDGGGLGFNLAGRIASSCSVAKSGGPCEAAGPASSRAFRNIARSQPPPINLIALHSQFPAWCMQADASSTALAAPSRSPICARVAGNPRTLTTMASRQDDKEMAVLSQQVPFERKDEAWDFLQSHADVQNAEHINLPALRRKIDWHIVPLMFCCYTLQFIDKVIINYAAVMGISTDLKLKGNDFSNAATSFFIAYLVAEAPNTWLLQKVPAAKWLGVNVALWGVVVAATSGVKDYTGLVIARVFLGLFEATIGPSLMIISSQYYTKEEQAPRFCLWYCGLGVGQIVGGLVSFAFQHISPHAPLSGWRVMFIVLGIVTTIIGVATFFGLPDTPMKASFMSDAEKVALLKHISSNKTGVWNQKFQPRQVIEALLDVQVWLLTLMVVLDSVSSGVVTTYSSTLIKNLGFSSQHAALLNMPSGIVSIFFTLLVGFGIRRSSHRWAWVFFCSIPGIIGGGLMSFLPNSNKAGLLIGVYLVNAIVAPLPIILPLVRRPTAPGTRSARSPAPSSRARSRSATSSARRRSRPKDAPEYRPAKIAVLATQAAAAGVAVALFVYYVWENKRRDARKAVSGEMYDDASNETAWAGLTDKENKSFRYVY
ncbi:MFS transporter [Rasamsonia emersonii CBS 393.64]|uniref:MFS transporter n=1 Tax=Rasamsonia emersonii (strain ATCC 16479 / CBS 393.64 / IMI 116815) TaxID=1408163 RepID=A0A0F4YLJ4_RASE3|nr:MFS transporter [Rasamsonia emersonii CBS 393.64]KKA18483.1 MFS transporter [Rasamsonia emersonii CBS 393.64]